MSWPMRLWSRDQSLDLHNRIKLKISTHSTPADAVWVALLEVVNRHAPVVLDLPGGVWVECGGCGDDDEGQAEMYPCAEVRLIADCLGVPADDGTPPRRA